MFSFCLCCRSICIFWQIITPNNPDVWGDKSLISDGVVQAGPGPGRRRSFYLTRTIKQYLVRNEKEAEIIECQRGSGLNQMITIIRIRNRPICLTGQLYNWINRIWQNWRTGDHQFNTLLAFNQLLLLKRCVFQERPLSFDAHSYG